MKTIKNYKYLLLIALVTLVYSCAEGDKEPVAQASKNIQVVIEPFVASQIDIVGQVGSNTAEVNLGFRMTPFFSSTYEDSDIIITYQGADYVISPRDNDGDGFADADTKEVIVGLTSVTFELEAVGGEAPFEGTTVSTEIDFDDYYEITVVDRPSDLVVLKQGGIEVNAILYNQVPQTNPNAVELLLDWRNPSSNDVDLYFSLGDVNGDYLGWYLRSWTVSRYEDLSLPIDGTFDDSAAIAPDQYFVEINTRWAGRRSIDYKLFIAYPDGTMDIIDGTTTSGVANNMDIKVTKTTNMDTGDAEFVFEAN